MLPVVYTDEVDHSQSQILVGIPLGGLQVELQGEYYAFLEYSCRAAGGILYIPRIFK